MCVERVLIGTGEGDASHGDKRVGVEIGLDPSNEHGYMIATLERTTGAVSGRADQSQRTNAVNAVIITCVVDLFETR
jgi:hypothetical protein